MRGRCVSARIRDRRSAAPVLAGLVILVAASQAMAFDLTSPAFATGAEIPVQYTCDGPNVSPPLRWADPPARTGVYVLIADDPDAPGGTWVHWVLYGMPPSARGIPESVPPRDEVAGIGRQGLNDFKRVGYGGPCPPRGPAHRYFFKLYAVDREVALSPGKTKAEVLDSIQGHVLGQAELMGRYQRR
jgi:Raf kinase inhibitor-like YbhB/YbcL family protein